MRSLSRKESIAPEERTLSRPVVAKLHDIVNDIYHDSVNSGVVDPSHPATIARIEEGTLSLPPEILDAVSLPASLAGVARLRSEANPILPTDATDQLGPTPRSWQEAYDLSLDPAYCKKYPGTHKAAIGMIVLSRAAGEPFGWQGQQFGRLVNSVIPVKGEETGNSGASSTTLLTPHVEDSFHPQRANQIMLGCLRNPGVGTTIAPLRAVRLSSKQETLLAEATLPILPDISYGERGDQGYSPVPIPTFTHDSEGARQFFRFDPDYTPLHQASPEFQNAYNHLGDELGRVSISFALLPGELLVMDNDLVVHGRVPFAPRYDGYDRYLLRTNVRRPEIVRPAAEANEHGYGQGITRPF